jgi:hypothetical protein
MKFFIRPYTNATNTSDVTNAVKSYCEMKFFICSYTNAIKSYCDKRFIDNLHGLSMNNPVFIVDNTLDNGVYLNKLRTLTQRYSSFSVVNHFVNAEPKISQFQRNVVESVNVCRDKFLQSDCDHMLIVESDVIPPANLLAMFHDDAINLSKENWGIIGAKYYKGFHNFSLQGVQKINHVLSGCTLYNKELIKKVKFRYLEKQLSAFPDAFMSLDASGCGYTLWNDYRISCDHLEAYPGDRGHLR